MPLDLASFRQQLLTALQTARSRWPASNLYLLYAPGFDDPLGLAQGNEAPQRTTALVPWAQGAGYDKPHFPRIIEFDCRRVAAFLLETDPAFDDPLLEDSIAHAHRALLSPWPEPGDKDLGRSVCGWLASPDSAATIAGRFTRASQRLDAAQGRRYWMRWHSPQAMALMWPQMTTAQRLSLLGEQLTWLAFDAAGHLAEFSSPSADEAGSDASSGAAPLSITRPQWTAVHHLGVVNHLVDAWREQRGAPLPHDATEAVYRQAVRAQAHGLDGRDVQVFVLTVLELRHGFEADTGFLRAVDGAARNPGTLADRIDELPPEFWRRYGPRP